MIIGFPGYVELGPGWKPAEVRVWIVNTRSSNPTHSPQNPIITWVKLYVQFFLLLKWIWGGPNLLMSKVPHPQNSQISIWFNEHLVSCAVRHTYSKKNPAYISIYIYMLSVTILSQRALDSMATKKVNIWLLYIILVILT